MFGFPKPRKKELTRNGERPAEAMAPADGLDLTLLVPLIKVIEMHDPSVAEVTLSRDDSPVMRPFAADLMVMYAIDLPTHFQFVSYRDLRNSSISEEQLHSLALGNLQTRVPKIELHGQAPRYMVTAGGNFEATLLLLDSMWEQFAEHMPGELLAVVPARDLLFVSASGWEGSLPFIQEMANIDPPEKRYALSRCVLARRGGKWIPYALPA